MFESICDKRCHVRRVLHNIDSMTEDTRGSCWTVYNHAKINKIIQWYQLIVFILYKWGNIGNKIGSYQIYDFDHRFNMNYMSYCWFQMSILISNIQALSHKLGFWVQTCIIAKKLDSLIQISSYISKVLQSEHHRDLFKNHKSNIKEEVKAIVVITNCMAFGRGVLTGRVIYMIKKKAWEIASNRLDSKVFCKWGRALVIDEQNRKLLTGTHCSMVGLCICA